MGPVPARKNRGPAFSLLDAAALVVGYSLASLLVRAYWPESGAPSVWAVGMIAMVFSWLGLAMSGPVVVMTRPPTADPDGDGAPSRTWAELAWMVIGFYWIGLTVLVVPVRMNGSRVVDSAVLGMFPVITALLIWRFGPRRSWASRAPDGPSWAHRAAVFLLATWPFAWVGLIALGKAL